MKICNKILIENINITCTFLKTKGNHDILFPYVFCSYVLLPLSALLPSTIIYSTMESSEESLSKNIHQT